MSENGFPSSEKRMYVLVPYNLSDIQKGIQAAHAIAEFQNTGFEKEKYSDWVRNWKTIIVLNGGTTCHFFDEGKYYTGQGTLQKYRDDLHKLGIDTVTFQEPDLNNAETAIAFVVDMEEDSHIVGYLKQMGLA